MRATPGSGCPRNFDFDPAAGTGACAAKARQNHDEQSDELLHVFDVSLMLGQLKCAAYSFVTFPAFTMERPPER